MKLDEALALADHASPMPHLAGQALRVLRDYITAAAKEAKPAQPADSERVGDADGIRCIAHFLRALSPAGETWRPNNPNNPAVLDVRKLADRLEAALDAHGQGDARPNAGDLTQLKKAVEDWDDGVDTDVPQHALMRLTGLGLLVAEMFEVTKKGMDLLAAVPSAPEGNANG